MSLAYTESDQFHPLDLITQIRKIAGPENTLSSGEDLICYGYDATNSESLPELVVLPNPVRKNRGEGCQCEQGRSRGRQDPKRRRPEKDKGLPHRL